MATIGISLSDVNTVAEGPAFRLGTRGVLETAAGTKEYVYVQNGPTLALTTGSVLAVYGSAWVAAPLTDVFGAVARGAMVGVNQSLAASNGAVAVNNYFWMQIYGRCSVITLASMAAGSKAYVTATAGAIDDAATAGLESIEGLFLGTATGGATAINPSATLTYPTVGDTA